MSVRRLGSYNRWQDPGAPQPRGRLWSPGMMLSWYWTLYCAYSNAPITYWTPAGPEAGDLALVCISPMVSNNISLSTPNPGWSMTAKAGSDWQNACSAAYGPLSAAQIAAGSFGPGTLNLSVNYLMCPVILRGYTVQGAGSNGNNGTSVTAQAWNSAIPCDLIVDILMANSHAVTTIVTPASMGVYVYTTTSRTTYSASAVVSTNGFSARTYTWTGTAYMSLATFWLRPNAA